MGQRTSPLRAWHLLAARAGALVAVMLAASCDAESPASGGTTAVPRATTFAVIGGDPGLHVSLEAIRSNEGVRLDLTGFLGATDGELEIDCAIDGQQPVTFNTVKPLTVMDVSTELLRSETSQTARISCAGSLDGFEFSAEFDVPPSSGDVPGWRCEVVNADVWCDVPDEALRSMPGLHVRVTVRFET